MHGKAWQTSKYTVTGKCAPIGGDLEAVAILIDEREKVCRLSRSDHKPGVDRINPALGYRDDPWLASLCFSDYDIAVFGMVIFF